MKTIFKEEEMIGILIFLGVLLLGGVLVYNSMIKNAAVRTVSILDRGESSITAKLFSGDGGETWGFEDDSVVVIFFSRDEAGRSIRVSRRIEEESLLRLIERYCQRLVSTGMVDQELRQLVFSVARKAILSSG